MKISGIKYSLNINFKANNNKRKEDNTVLFGYDDAISSARREYIRDHFSSGININSDTQGERLEEYELKTLIAELLGGKVNQDAISQSFLIKKGETSTKIEEQPEPEENGKDEISKINRKLMDNICAYNISPIYGSESYRGAMCDMNKENLAIVKKAGIKRVIDLAGCVSKEKCEEAGLEYLSFPMGMTFYNSQIFKDESEIIRQNTMLFRDILNMDEKSAKKAIKEATDTHRKDKRKEIERFVIFIQTMQKDNVYIGCELGTYETDTALMLNYLFNPKAQNTPSCIKRSSALMLHGIENLYNGLSGEDKAKMGWDKEFDDNFIPKLREIEKHLGC